MNSYDDTYYSVIFKILDQKEFEPFRRKICDLMRTPLPIEPLVRGAEVRGAGWGNRHQDIRDLEKYIDYVTNAIGGNGSTGNPCYVYDLLTYEQFMDPEEQESEEDEPIR